MSNVERDSLLAPVGIALLALAMGLPTLGGRFVGGDDHDLVLDHVLVSRPSLEHALKLFTIVHRDLYQPLPLLSFSLEFALADALGLRADQTGPGGGAWIFHLTNVLLHAATSVLVWALLVRLSAGRAVAALAAALFAVHPLQVEVVAWVNGRMMLLSTFFALATLVTLARHLERPRLATGVWTVLLVVCSAISKVRVVLPLLMFIVPLARGARLDRRFWWVWAPSAAATAAFALLNIHATSASEAFFQGSDVLQGSRIARTILALAIYVTHFVWPAGLASWYEAPRVATWSDGRVWWGLAVVLPVLAAAALSARRTRVSWLGIAWFLIAIADTLPLVPTRNVLAADRYMYLPMAGLAWWCAAAATAAFRRTRARARSAAIPVALVTVAAAALAALLATAWHTARYYQTSLLKAQRIADIHPHSPNVRVWLGWAHYRLGQFDQAMEIAQSELTRSSGAQASENLQLIAACQTAQGKPAEAAQTLRRAVAADPADKLARFKLAGALADAGESDEALALFDEVLPQLPRYNPGMMQAADFYRQLGRDEKARELYHRVLDNNSYDIFAPLKLAEMDMEAGHYAQAAERLEALRAWMPDHAPAGVALGVCYTRLGRTADAIAVYEDVIKRDPNAFQAMLNLGLVLRAEGDAEAALPWLQRAADTSQGALEALIALHQTFLMLDRPNQAVSTWRAWLPRDPNNPDKVLWLAWALAISGAPQEAASVLDGVAAETAGTPLRRGVEVLIDLVGTDPRRAADGVDRLAEDGRPAAADVRDHLLDAVLWLGRRREQAPWPYYVAARLFEAAGRLDSARAGYQAFIGLINDPAAADRARARMSGVE